MESRCQKEWLESWAGFKQSLIGMRDTDFDLLGENYPRLARITESLQLSFNCGPWQTRDGIEKSWTHCSEFAYVGVWERDVPDGRDQEFQDGGVKHRDKRSQIAFKVTYSYISGTGPVDLDPAIKTRIEGTQSYEKFHDAGLTKVLAPNRESQDRPWLGRIPTSND